MRTTPGPWLNTSKAAEYMSVSTEHVNRIIRRGELQAVKLGQTYRTTPEWCDAYMHTLEAA